MQLGTQTNGLGGPSFGASFGHSVAGRSPELAHWPVTPRASLSGIATAPYEPAITAHRSASARSNPLYAPFLIAGEKILKTGLTPSLPISNVFLIATPNY